ncbi:MAG: DUF4199 domain-containing protein [Polyangiaceae bacterium]|nr:DUF4199 domain-containing protein [Polyangiaceae bacterium]
MKQIVVPGVVLGALVAAWTFVMGLTGWYKDPALLNLFWMVTVIEIAVLVWALRKTAQDGRGYGRQVFAGTAIAAISMPIIFGGSLLFTTVAFPRYFEEVRQVHEQMLRAQGLPADKIAEALEEAKKSQTPMISALSGAIGTLVTGLVASAVIAIFVRTKPGTTKPT